jgi:hypothetical protein
LSCGSALFSSGGFNGGPSTKQVTNYPIRETRAGEPGAVLAEDEAVGDALGEQQFRKVYTPPAPLNGPTLPSLTDQVVVQQQQIADTCHQDIVAARWHAFFACPVGWIVVLLGIGWLLSVIFGGGGGGGFDATITRDIFTGGWILRIWEK